MKFNGTAATVTAVTVTSGTSVILTGTGFSTTPANNVVKFNGTTAIVSAATATSLTVNVPDGGSTGKITVQVGNQVATSIDDFVYIHTVGTVVTLAGNGALGFVNGSVAAAQFLSHTGVALDASGNVYVADAENHSIRKITPTGTVSTPAGSGTSGSADGAGAAAQFNSPRAVAWMP